MAATITLSALRDICKQRTDNVNSSYITDSEWNSMINKSYTELYDLLSDAYGDSYYASSTTLSTTAGTDTVSIAGVAAFYKLLGVYVQDTSSTRCEMNRMNLHDLLTQPRQSGWTVYNGTSNVYYSIQGGLIRFWPVPDKVYTIELWYLPTTTLLSGDSDTLDGINGWEEYVIVDTCIKALAKEESDSSVFQAQKAQMRDRINRMKLNRDADQVVQVRDEQRRKLWRYWP